MFNIFVFMGPSGTGKSTLQKLLGYNSIVTWTSRLPRVGEVDGVHYHFANREEILNMYKEGLLLEYTEYNGNIYGMALKSIEELINTKSHASIVVDVNGAKKLKDRFPKSILIIGVIAPYEECKERLMDRGDKNVNQRLSTYTDEINSVVEVSDIIVNNSKANLEKVSSLMKVLKLGI